MSTQRRNAALLAGTRRLLVKEIDKPSGENYPDDPSGYSGSRPLIRRIYILLNVHLLPIPHNTRAVAVTITQWMSITL